MNIGLWWWSNRPHGPADWHGPIGGFALSAFQRYQNPLKNDFPTDAQIDSDLKLLRQYSSRIRIYSMLQNPQTTRLAQKEGLDELAGAWIDARLENNENEIETLIAQARRYPKTISRVIVGNEVLFRNDIPPEQLMAYVDRVRAAIRQPVSVAEPDYIWVKYPELVRHVDFITVHLFPYWNGIPRSDAIGAAWGSYETLHHLYPDKPIVIGEIGWPSNGDRFKYADPSISNEAIFLRNWFNWAKQHRFGDYYVMEAFDQPWKEQLSGRTEA